MDAIAWIVKLENDRELESLGVDWDKGLPPDLLALVARAADMQETKVMRRVSRTWQQGFELGVRCIAVHFEDPVLPNWLKTAQRFPALTMLDLGASRTSTNWLANLRAFPKLRSLKLGSGMMSEDRGRARWFADADILLLFGVRSRILKPQSEVTRLKLRARPNEFEAVHRNALHSIGVSHCALVLHLL